MKWKAFTIIELLIVISLIAFLVAISIPSLQSSRRQAKAILCGSNVKQLVLGLISYETENESFPHALDVTSLEPPPGGYPGYFQYDRVGWWWFNYITDYSIKTTNKAGVDWCPARQVKNNSLKDSVLCGNYGVNQSICKISAGSKSHAEFIGRPLHAVDIPHPSQTLLLLDASYSMINWWHVTDKTPIALSRTSIEDTAYVPGLWINEDRTLWPGQEDDAIRGRHPHKTVNIGFADGNVSREKADDLFVEKTGDTYENLRPLWIPK